MSDTPFDPRYGEAVPVAEAVVRVTAHNPGPFTGAGTNSYVLGERELMVLDPGPKDPNHLDALKRAIAGRPVTHVLVSHTHRDHVDGLADVLATVGGVTVGEGPYRNARPLKPGEENPFLKSSDTAFHPDQRIADGEAVTNGDVTVTAIATPGHNANHLAFVLGDVCFSADHVMGWSTTVVAPPDGNMGDYLASLDRLMDETHRLYLPGHGQAIEEPQKAVSAMKSHRLMRERAILERVRAGDEGLPEIVDALYAGISEALRTAAGLSVLAHLEKLEEDGLVTSKGLGRHGRWRAR